jgi:hypothetical protein
MSAHAITRRINPLRYPSFKVPRGSFADVQHCGSNGAEAAAAAAETAAVKA